ncbi:MAG: outer membrane protein [Rhodomicrobium sp.]
MKYAFLKTCRLPLAAAFALAAFSAQAADLYAPSAKDAPMFAVANWTGFYAGVNGGYAWSNTNDQLALGGGFGGVAPEGGFGGGQIGYNVQRDRIVFGIEADIQGGSIGGSGTDVFGDPYKSELDYFGTVRGRLGYAFDRALVYATGGLAYGEVKNSASPLGVPFSIDNTAVGYVLGGGVEYKVGGAWSVKGEYQYINLGKNDPTSALVGCYSSSGGTVNDDAYHTVRVGLNYHIAPSYEPLK